MADRSSRPHASPARTPVRTERRIIGLRVSRRLGPARIAFRLGLNPSTVHTVLARYRCPPLAHLDRASGRRRSAATSGTAPGELVHVDIKKLGNIPDGGGWRATGRGPRQASNQAATTTARAPARQAPSATPTCTPPSMTTPAWPTPRSSPMSARKPPPRSGPAPTPGSPPPGSPSSAS